MQQQIGIERNYRQIKAPIRLILCIILWFAVTLYHWYDFCPLKLFWALIKFIDIALVIWSFPHCPDCQDLFCTCAKDKMNCCFSMNNFGKSVGSSCLGWGEGDNYMMQNPAQLHLHINRPNQKCKLQSEEILKARDNWADNKRSNSHIAEGFKLLSVSGNSFFTSKM